MVSESDGSSAMTFRFSEAGIFDHGFPGRVELFPSDGSVGSFNESPSEVEVRGFKPGFRDSYFSTG